MRISNNFYYLYLILSILTVPIAFGAQKWTSNETISIEMKTMVDSINLFDSEQREEANKLLTKLNIHLKKITNVNRVITIEINKVILQQYRNNQTELKQNIRNKILKIKDLVQSEKNSYHPFSLYLINSLLNEFKTLVDTPYFRTFVNKFKYQPSKITLNDKTLEKKIKFILPWINNILEINPQEFNLFVSKIIINILRSLDLNLQIITNNAENLKSKDLTFFNQVEIPKEIQKATNIEKILDIEPSDIIPTKTNVSANFLPPDYPKIDPDYKPPKTLPMPVNDWILDM
jgi:hypothetical protein